VAKPSYNSLSSARGGKRSWVVAAIVVAALLTNANLTAFHDVTGNSMHAKWGVTLFALVTGIAYAGGLRLLWFTNRIGKDLITKSKTFRMMGKVTSVIQYALIVIIAGLIVQMFLDSHYSLSLIILATALSTIPYPIPVILTDTKGPK